MPASTLTKKPFASRVRASSVKVIAENRDASLKQFRELKAQRFWLCDAKYDAQVS